MIGMGSLRVRVVVILVAVVLLNVIGMVRYPGGPLRPGVSDDPLWLDLTPPGEGWSVGTQASEWSAVGRTIYIGADPLTNPWPWAATVEAITPMDITGGLVVDQILVGVPGSASAGVIGIGFEAVLPNGSVMSDLYRALPARIEGQTTLDKAIPILLVVHGDRPGPAGFTGLAIDYRVGPFTFRVVQHMGVTLCLGPWPADQDCPLP